MGEGGRLRPPARYCDGDGSANDGGGAVWSLLVWGTAAPLMTALHSENWPATSQAWDEWLRPSLFELRTKSTEATAWKSLVETLLGMLHRNWRTRAAPRASGPRWSTGRGPSWKRHGISMTATLLAGQQSPGFCGACARSATNARLRSGASSLLVFRRSCTHYLGVAPEKHSRIRFLQRCPPPIRGAVRIARRRPRENAPPRSPEPAGHPAAAARRRWTTPPAPRHRRCRFRWWGRGRGTDRSAATPR